MQYNFPMTLDRQFKNKLESLRDKYGSKMMEIEGMSPKQLDTCNFFKNFIDRNTVADSSIDDNANVSSKSITTMLHEANKPFTKLLSRNKIYIEMKAAFSKEIADDFLESVVNGELYEHDSHLSSYMPYCFAYSLDQIVNKGLFFIHDMKAGPAKHWDTFNHHVLEFISYASNQQAGAVGIPDYLVYACYYFMKDGKELDDQGKAKFQKQKFQEFIYNLNQPYLRGGIQSAYTNVSILDREHFYKFFANKKYPNGDLITDYVEENMQFQKDFMTFLGHQRKVNFYTFPVVSASLIFKEGNYIDEDMAKAVVKHNYEFGFNDINIMNVDEVTSLASCCRLVSNKVELKKHKVFNSIGGSELNVGSTKVVTINLVRYALNANNQEEFLADIEKQVRLIHKYHYAQRNCLKKLITKGLLPLYSHKLMDLEDQFATIGINGVFEAMYLLGGIDSDESGVFYNETGFEIANNMFELINQLNDETYEKYGYMSNVEQVPAESAAVKLNKKDRIIFGNLKIDKLLGADCDIYGNQWIPLKESSSVFNRIEAAKLDNKCGGGAILHINLGENFNSFEDAYTFTKGLANSGVRYFSYISLINICEDEHSYLTEDCPVCGKETVSKGIKIVGYLVKQDSYKSERKRELQDRKFYTL